MHKKPSAVRFYRKKPHILVVDDDKDIRDLLSNRLTEEGYRVITVADAGAGLEHARNKQVDLAVLDINLPGQSGLEVCRRLRADSKTRHIPIIMLTARGEEMDRIIGLELGADDYVAKPFSIRELVLRVRRFFDRHGASEENSERIKIGVLTLDMKNHLVRVKNKTVDLTLTEFKLLATLVESPGQVKSRDLLLDSVWEFGDGVYSRTIDTHMQRLRAKLKEAGSYIETVRGVGYRFHS